MLSSKWLYVAGHVMITPVVVILCWIAVDQFFSAEVTVSWGSGGKHPPSARASTDIYLIAVVAVCVWFGSLYRVVKMFKTENPGD